LLFHIDSHLGLLLKSLILSSLIVLLVVDFVLHSLHLGFEFGNQSELLGILKCTLSRHLVVKLLELLISLSLLFDFISFFLGRISLVLICQLLIHGEFDGYGVLFRVLDLRIAGFILVSKQEARSSTENDSVVSFEQPGLHILKGMTVHENEWYSCLV